MKISNNKRLYCDLNVLADLDEGFRREVGFDPYVLSRHFRYREMEKPNFFRNLPLTNDGAELWRGIAAALPVIIAGVASPPKRCGVERFEWCERELRGADVYIETTAPSFNHVDKVGREYSSTNGDHGTFLRDDFTINVITCWSSQKHEESGLGRVLISEDPLAGADWEVAGGEFVHHTVVANTLNALRNLCAI
jgi:hypothetical protein